MDKLDILKNTISSYEKLCIGFSGGVDSTLLLKVSADVLGKNAVAIIADGIMLPRKDLEEAKARAEEIGVHYEVIKLNILEVPEFKNNDVKRCYYCKKTIFGAIKERANELGINYIADGKNLDDANVYRPGMKAAEELGIVSPLFECGLSKKEIRELSHRLNLDTWRKPSNACLATRFPYNTVLTCENINKAQEAEAILSDIGMSGVRARIHEGILRIEAPKEQFEIILGSSEAIKALKELGFSYVTLDLEGFRSGSMDLEKR